MNSDGQPSPSSLGDLTVDSLHVNDGNYTLPVTAPSAGDVILSDGTSQLIFGPASSAGYVISDAVSITNGDIAVFSSSSPTHINNAINISNIVTNPATANLDMDGYRVDDISSEGLTLFEGSVVPAAGAGRIRLYANSSDNSLYVANNVPTGGRLIYDYAPSGKDQHIQNNKIVTVDTGGTNSFSIRPQDTGFSIYNEVMGISSISVDRSTNNSSFKGNVDLQTGSANIRAIDTTSNNYGSRYSVEQSGGTGGAWYMGFDSNINFSLRNATGTKALIADYATGNVTHSYTSALNGAVTLNTGSNTVSLPITRGTSGQVIASDGAGASTWTTPKLSFTLGFGATCNTGSAGYLVAQTRDNAATQGSLTNITTMYVPVASTLLYTTFATQAGDTTSQFSIYKAGVQQGTFLMSSTLGGVVSQNISFTAGQSIGVRWNAIGTAPLGTNMQMYFMQT